MEQVQRTVFYQSHVDADAKMVDFAGWQMPIQYSDGIVSEHLLTRRGAGLFDVSHMGRFQITGPGAVAFLQYVLTNDCAKLAVGQAQYTILANESGGAVDDAFLYCPEEGSFLLVVNASNKDKDWKHLQRYLADFPEARMDDVSDSLAMLALQGPQSEAILQSLVTAGTLSEPKRNAVGTVTLAGVEVLVARTGYTGAPVCFELFIPVHGAASIWNKLLEAGAKPVGLGARDTLRLEAGLPLYGHELGMGQDDREIPVFAIGLAIFAVSLRIRPESLSAGRRWKNRPQPEPTTSSGTFQTPRCCRKLFASSNCPTEELPVTARRFIMRAKRLAGCPAGRWYRIGK